MDYKKTEVTKGAIKVIIQFSEETENQELVEKEVKEILKGALLEQLHNLHGKDENNV